MKAFWQLHENNGIKYFRLHFTEPWLEDLIGLFSTRKNNTEKESKDFFWTERILGITKINFLYQTHSDKVLYIPNNKFTENRVEGDGLFTDQTNVFLGVKVADCLPIYCFSPFKKIIGIVHSGWRGTLNEIGAKAALGMSEQFNMKLDQLCFAFGPSINACCYEIKQDLEVRFDQFLIEKDIHKAIVMRENKTYLNLKKINQKLLQDLNLIKVADLDIAHSTLKCNISGCNL